MSMPNEFPGNHDPFEDLPNGHEFDGEFELVKLINDMHQDLEAGMQFDEGISETRQARDVAIQLGIGRYVTGEGDTTATPADFKMMVFEPREDSESARDIKCFFLRFTDLPAWTHGIDDETDIRANDILLELEATTGNNYRYLINSQGITPYADAESLQYDDSELAERAVKRPNIFSVTENYWFTPPMSTQQFRAILSSSVAKLQ